MINRINKLLFRKKRGEVIGGFMASAICFMFLAFIIVKFGIYNKTSSIRYKFDNTLKQYILQMESTGYLTPEGELDLNNDLKEIGIRNISIVGTKTKVNYGSEIYLEVSGKVLIDKVEKDGLKATKKEELKDISGKLSSTAKS